MLREGDISLQPKCLEGKYNLIEQITHINNNINDLLDSSEARAPQPYHFHISIIRSESSAQALGQLALQCNHCRSVVCI
jgi:2'-5' RNA ligase